MDGTYQDGQGWIESAKESGTRIVLVDVKSIEIVLDKEGELCRLAFNSVVVLSIFRTRRGAEMEKTAGNLVSFYPGHDADHSSVERMRNCVLPYLDLEFDRKALEVDEFAEMLDIGKLTD